MVDIKKPAPVKDPLAELEKMRQETDAILEASARLMREMEERLEETRQHRAVQEALLAQRKATKADK